MSQESVSPEVLAALNQWVGRLKAIWRWLRRLFVLVCWGGLALGWGCMVFIEWSAESVTLLAVANYLPLAVWMLPAGLLGLGAVFFHRGSLVPVLGYLAYAWFGFSGWESRGATFRPEENLLPPLGDDHVRVLTCNRGQSQGHSLQPFLLEVSPDVVALQDSAGKADYYRRTEAYQPFRFIAEKGEFLLLSRWPIVAAQPILGVSIPEAGMASGMVGARFELLMGERKVAVYNLHLPSPRRYLGSLGLRSVLPEAVDWATGAESDMHRYWTWREEQGRALSRLLAAESLPWLAVGDLNTPPRGKIHGFFEEVGVDLHEVCGSGFGFTFPGTTRNPLAFGGPWMRIDYVIAGEGQWEGRWMTVEPAGRGQHRAVAAELRLR